MATMTETARPVKAGRVLRVQSVGQDGVTVRLSTFGGSGLYRFSPSPSAEGFAVRVTKCSGDEAVYDVRLTGRQRGCTCPAGQHGRSCKHIGAADALRANGYLSPAFTPRKDSPMGA